MYGKIKILLIILCLLSTNNFGQVYSFSEIKENFYKDQPQTRDASTLENLFGSIDDLIFGAYPPLHPQTKWFFKSMLQKALLEIQTEQVTEGATIWQIYNHGFVVKTPSITIGFDLHDIFETEEFLEFANILDIYFISHEHRDHYSQALITLMKSLDKPVVGPSEFSSVPIGMSSGTSKVISNLNVTAHFGLHSVPVRQFEVITSEGLKFLHTGDNQTSLTLPDISDVDVMMLNSWINESGAESWVIGVRKAIDKIKPIVTLPGHMMELGHLGGTHPPVPYRDPIESDDGTLASEYYILGWGERYHYNNNSNDIVKPNIVQNLDAVVVRDSILLSWDLPQTAADGDEASFYRMIQDDAVELFITGQEYICEIDSLREFYFKVYSYDDCGNQSQNYAELHYTPPANINYSPRITIFSPYEDTVSTFVGVHKQFSISAKDLNGDELLYSWLLDQTTELNFTAEFPFNISNLDSGYHQLSVLVYDQQDTVKKSWWVNYHTDYAIIDNEDFIMYSDSGSWESSTLLKAYGASSRYTSISNVGDWAMYKFYPEAEGEYNLFEIVAKQTIYLSFDAAYYIYINEVMVDSIHINQNEGSGDWVQLGSYNIPAGANVGVKIMNTGSASAGIALLSDAIKFEYVGNINNIDKLNEKNPDKYFLSQNYPNPFNPSTKINYSIPNVETHGHASVQLKVYDVLGREVSVLVNKQQKPGNYEINYNASNLTSGVYFYRIRATPSGGQAGEFIETKKMLLLK